MRMVFEQVDEDDFLEFILTENDLLNIEGITGVTRNYPSILGGKRNLNVFIRKETDLKTFGAEHAIDKRKGIKS